MSGNVQNLKSKSIDLPTFVLSSYAVLNQKTFSRMYAAITGNRKWLARVIHQSALMTSWLFRDCLITSRQFHKNKVLFFWRKGF